MLTKIILFIFINFTLFAYDKTTDDKNVYFESSHFRTIAGIAYSNATSVESFSDKLLNAAEISWTKEVEELEFKQPKNTDIKKIDIYIGNKSAYNYETESYETISSSYAGWAISYPSDDTPYFLINPIVTDEQLKVTISHEFFHTIQYSYIDQYAMSDKKWRNNIWWMEATAVLMEDEVYPNVNDYINFLKPFFTASYKNFEIYDGMHEYSMVIFAKYIREKYGLQIIKDAFSSINESGEDGYFEILDTLLKKDYNSSMQQSLNEFTKWVNNSEKYFVDGRLYPSLKHYKSSDDFPIEKGGVKVVDNLVVGWNMLALNSEGMDKIESDNIEVVWSYENGLWKNSVNNEITDTNSSLGYWIKAKSISSLNYTHFDKSSLDITNLSTGWNLLGTTEIINLDRFKDASILLWQYNNGKWFVYSNNTEISEQIENLGYHVLKIILPYSSYWIKKLI